MVPVYVRDDIQFCAITVAAYDALVRSEQKAEEAGFPRMTIDGVTITSEALEECQALVSIEYDRLLAARQAEVQAS